ncbi:Protein of unknown function, partial [Cotesia congregata]
TNLISVSKITRNDREILFRKDDALIRDLNGDVKMVADRIGDLYYLREQEEQVKSATIEKVRTSETDLWHARLGHLHMDADDALIRDLNGDVKMVADRIGDLYYLREQEEQVKSATIEKVRTSETDLWHARLGHLHMDAETPEPGRVTKTRRSCEEHDREISPVRARGRPRKQKSGKPGRPRKLYRYVSASSIASSRENLSEDEEVPPGQDDEEIPEDVFIQNNEQEVPRTKRPLETSLFQEDKRPRNDRSSSDSEKSPKKDGDNTDEGEEFMDAKFIEELAKEALQKLSWCIYYLDNYLGLPI